MAVPRNIDPERSNNPFHRKMSLRSLIAFVLLAVVFAVEFSYGSFCDEGPPGRYCFVDLSGWYECTLDSKIQKMIQKEHQCPTNTRYSVYN